VLVVNERGFLERVLKSRYVRALVVGGLVMGLTSGCVGTEIDSAPTRSAKPLFDCPPGDPSYVLDVSNLEKLDLQWRHL
jgi:hypothetical protein